METLSLIGRILFGGYFLYSGANHFLKSGMMTGYAKTKGAPSPRIAVPLSGLLLILGGLSILLGIHPTVGAVLLLIFLLPVTFIMHNFWKPQDQNTKSIEAVNFLKNLALVGALLMFLALPVL